jgi:hypothetical protein
MIREENKMKKFKTMKKSMRVLITILISLVFINSALMVATVIASAAVIPTADASKLIGNDNFAATRISEMQAINLETSGTPVGSANVEKSEVLDTTSTASKGVTTSEQIAVVTKHTAAATSKSTSSVKKTYTATATKADATTRTNTTTTKVSTTTSTTSGISTLKDSVNSSLINAFDQLKFKVVLNPNSSYLGYFSTSRHSLEMRSVSVSTFRHEMGHFLDVLKNMPSRSSTFAGIYSREKNDYSGTNATYIKKNAQEYFAQSYRNYLENASKLKSERPETYAFVKDQVTSITSTDISRTYNMYSWSW